MMDVHTRRVFLRRTLLAGAGLAGLLRPVAAAGKRSRQVMTVTGPVDAADLRNTLPHEHILVDFIGAADINPPRWDRDEVIGKVLPYLDEAKRAGCHTLVDCTPNYLGRDVVLLRQLAQKTGLQIITNTGYYGGSDNKLLPSHAFTETAQQLSARWVSEWKHGIDNTTVRPGFMKISVNTGHLSDASLKLIHAAALTHLKTGLTIASHTGPSIPAFEQIEVLKANRVDPSAFIWVHAQNEPDIAQHIRAVREGAWVSLDGLADGNVSDYLEMLRQLKKDKCLHRVLISHDAGWYDPAKPGGGELRGYTTLFRKLIPAMEQEGFTEEDILQIIRHNTADAFAIGVKRWKKRGRLKY